MKEILTYENDDGSRFSFTLEFNSPSGCDGCETNDNCYFDGEIPGLRGGCPLTFSNLVSRAPKE